MAAITLHKYPHIVEVAKYIGTFYRIGEFAYLKVR